MAVDIRELGQKELREALPLVRRVFDAFEAPEYAQQGVDEFHNCLCDEEFLAALTAYGAFEEDTLLGVLATRSAGSHISLFFVDAEHHRRGIGKALFRCALEKSPAGRMTVNSSPYAQPVYRRLGFVETDKEQQINGIRFIPMRYPQ